MTVRVGINGFGRIGRNFLRAVVARTEEPSSDAIEVVALNDVGSAETNAQLLRCDSTQGRFHGSVEMVGTDLVVNGRAIAVFSEREPAEIPWKDAGVDLVLEAVGRFTKRAEAAAHLDAGAQRVIITAPSPDADATFVIGVNDGEFHPERHVIVSNASCTTNCFVPMVKVLDDAFGIAGGLMTTVHAYTNDQHLLDLAHRDLRRARAAAMNIVPTTTGAARTVGKVLTSMQGHLDGLSVRVPVPVGSLTDFSAVVRAEVDAGQVNAAYERAAGCPPLDKVLVYSTEPLVSSDIIGSPASCTFDSELTMVEPIGDSLTLVKVQGWYDNEWGYSNRLVDLALLVGAGGVRPA